MFLFSSVSQVFFLYVVILHQQIAPFPTSLEGNVFRAPFPYLRIHKKIDQLINGSILLEFCYGFGGKKKQDHRPKIQESWSGRFLLHREKGEKVQKTKDFSASVLLYLKILNVVQSFRCYPNIM